MLRVVSLVLGIVTLGLAGPFSPLPAHAQVTVSMETGRLLANDGLRPGQSRWLPTAASAEGPVSIVVSLPLQRAWVFRGAVPIGISTVSTGQPGYDTPSGRFTILEKRVHHRSSLYDDAPMPFMQRLTWDGIALHAGHVPADPASHGCIRFPRAFAQRLFGITALGTSVTIVDLAPNDAEEAFSVATDIATLM